MFSITLSSFLEKTSLIIIHLISYKKKIIGRDFIIYSNIVKSFSFFYLFNVGLRLTESRKSLCVFFFSLLLLFFWFHTKISFSTIKVDIYAFNCNINCAIFFPQMNRNKILPFYTVLHIHSWIFSLISFFFYFHSM